MTSNQRRGEFEVKRWILSLDLKEEKDGASLMSFGREFQICGPADRKP